MLANERAAGGQEDCRIFSNSNLTSFRVPFNFVIPALYLQHNI
jgi:hypothetical protein